MRYYAINRPRPAKSGDVVYALDTKLLRRRDEIVLIVSLMTNRRLFGEFFGRLLPNYFHSMPPNSGIFVRPLVPTQELAPGHVHPGDIDLLLIPYEGRHLILDQIVAVETKAVRASFLKQGKSPNEFGFHQARGLLNLGFPYVAVAHLIVSDKSPEHAWTMTSMFKIVDEFGRAEPLPDQPSDMMPHSLIRRSFGRLERHCVDNSIGLASVYIGSNDDEIAGTREGSCIWMPNVRPAKLNEQISLQIMQSCANLFDKKYNSFFDNPRYDPI